MFQFVTKYQNFSPVFLRLGLSLVFLLFGVQKLLNPGQTTSEVQLLTNFDLVDAAAANFYSGLVEILVAGSFLFGFQVRLFALVSFVMVSIFFLSFLSKYGASINPDLYRDIGLAGASLALFLMGPGPISIDNSSSKEKKEVNKYVGLLLFAATLLSSGFIYQSYYKPTSIARIQATGETVTINMRVLQNQWKWQVDTIQVSHGERKEAIQKLGPIKEQATIRVQSGDKVKLNIYNEDTYDHGFAIDVFGVNKRLFPQTTTVVEFTASLAGRFNFYCSVPCGEGHYEQIGTLIVGDSQVQVPISQTIAFNSSPFGNVRQCQK